MKNILKDVLWDFLLKLSMHKKNIPGDEMETFVEKDRFLSNNIPLLFMNFLTNCLFKQPFSDPFTFLLFFFSFHHIYRVTSQMDCVQWKLGDMQSLDGRKLKINKNNNNLL